MGESQMTVKRNLDAGAPSTSKTTWNTIDWKRVKTLVNQLQMRIAKAVRAGRHHKAKALQWLLTHSYYAKLLATRRVTQNKGKKTPGIDGVIWETSKQKMQAALTLKRLGYHPQPLKRIYIPKKDGKKRPLSIPTMIDRTQQALHLMALEPFVETTADRHSYGFRPYRSCADAIEQCFNVLAKKRSATWVLEGDIKSCFDEISHTWMLKNTLMDKVMLKKWLKAGYIEKETFYKTDRGTAQGGIISPCLLVNVLSGLEAAVKAAVRSRDKVNVCVYADDFIVTGANREILENKVKPAIQAFLDARDLTLSEKKTKITHINKGFDFLSFSIRKYKGKLLIKPSKASIKRFLNNSRELIGKSAGWAASELIRQLNPKIRGWCNYFRHVVAKETFSKIDYHIFNALQRWSKRRHPEKSAQWRKDKYYRQDGDRDWIFYAKTPIKGGGVRVLDLFRASQTPIVRHVKIMGDATPYDPDFKDYFKQRRIKRKAIRRALGLLGQSDDDGLKVARAV